MSRQGPNAFIVVGDSDWWSPDLRSVEMSTDARLRGLLRNQAAGSWRSTIGVGIRSPHVTKRLLEYTVVNPPAMVGLVGVGFESATLATHVGAVGGIGYYTGDATIYENGAGSTVHTNLALAAAGDVIGVMLYREPTTPFAPRVRFLLNGRRNILGRSEDFGHADWQKLNGATAVGQRLTFVNTTSYFQQNITRVGAVGSQLTFSAWMTSSNSTTVRVTLADGVDGNPSHSQDVALVAGVRTRVTFAQTMGALYSGSLAV